MKWISVKDRLPQGPAIIMAMMNGRQECGGDPIKNAMIVLLRSRDVGDEWRTMDCTEIYYLPEEDYCRDWYSIIAYWMPFEEFLFPESMLIKDKD